MVTRSERYALEQWLLFLDEDCQVNWNVDISDKLAYLSWRASVAHQQERKSASLRRGLSPYLQTGETEKGGGREKGTSSSTPNGSLKNTKEEDLGIANVRTS